MDHVEVGDLLYGFLSAARRADKAMAEAAKAHADMATAVRKLRPALEVLPGPTVLPVMSGEFLYWDGEELGRALYASPLDLERLTTPAPDPRPAVADAACDGEAIAGFAATY